MAVEHQWGGYVVDLIAENVIASYQDAGDEREKHKMWEMNKF